MLDLTEIEKLQQTVAAEDWKTAVTVGLEIKLLAKGPIDRRCADALAQAVRANDAERVEEIIDNLEFANR